MPHSTHPDNGPQLVEDQNAEDLPDAPPLEKGSDQEDGSALKKQDVKLEDLFNDEDSDEEFTSSGATNGKIESSPPAAPM